MCTGIRLTAKNGNIVYGRTMEFGQPTESNIIVIPRNYSLAGESTPWRARYAAVGANMLGINHLVDGVNEKGLAGGLFYFPGYAGYQEVASAQEKTILAPWELLTWILTNFSHIDQVRESLPSIKVANTIFKAWGITPPVHAIIHDNTGKSLVIEYVNGTLHMHDADSGIITNSPTYDWHITNLKNYTHITPYNSQKPSFGQGSGMLGLPGDFTPPSRFVRAFFFSQSVLESATAHEARDTAFHILNLFNIPLGIIREKTQDEEYCDYTQWTSVCDLSQPSYYWHTYNNPAAQTVDLTKAQLDAQEIVTLAMDAKR
jgi:choloylglycine hydrolase